MQSARACQAGPGLRADSHRRGAAEGLAAGPVTDAAGIAVHELRVRVEAHASEAQRAYERQQRTGGHAANAEVDRMPLDVLALPRDLVPLLAQHQVVLR